MSDEKVICTCMDVTAGAIKEAFKNGARTVKDIQDATGAGTICGACLDEIEHLLDELKSGYSIAVDPSVIPYGTEVVINGVTCRADDCGGAIKGNRIDVYFNDHKEALEFGVQYANVFMEVE